MEISCVEYHNGNNRLSLENVEGSETEFRFNWRGNKISKDAFIPLPAHFEWAALGQLIRKGFDSGKISDSDMKGFIENFHDFKKSK